MASAVHVVLVAPQPGLLARIESRLAELEGRWSRFRADSELSRANRSGGGTLVVSADTRALVRAMQRASDATGGRFDPTMLAEICAHGYDSSVNDPTVRSVMIDLPAPDRVVGDIVVDDHSGTITMPAGLGIDPGAIGKGLAADLVVGELITEDLAAGALISVGGDLVVAGTPPASHGDRWQVAIADPFGTVDEIHRMALGGGGVATSSTRSRRWTSRQRVRHHLLDPARRAQSPTDLASATVVASTGWLAEAHATAALLEGSDHFIGYLERRGLDGVALTEGGELLRTAALRRRPAFAVSP